MARLILLFYLVGCYIVPLIGYSQEQASTESEVVPVPFAHGGKFKMLYDCRQRPQSVLLNERLYIVYNGDAEPSKNGNGKAYPMLVTCDPLSRSFSKPVRLGQEPSTDHHDSPIIWADEDDFLHVLFECHRTPGTHLVSEAPAQPESPEIRWRKGAQIAPSLSYPTVFRVRGDQEVIYYRTEGHTSSWTYRMSADNGETWVGPQHDVTDLDRMGKQDWSSYQNKLPSRDGRYLHVVYIDYDDNKTSPDPQRFYNPRYDQLASNEWKYNLSYVKIDLATHDVFNAEGKVLATPIDYDSSKANCEIWDTQWRGAGVPPVISLDEDGEPAFLHVLSEDDLESHAYYYVRREGQQWVQTRICKSNHQWNSGHLSRDESGVLHAYVIVGEAYLEGGYMDKHGGGRIEEWISEDRGNHWKKRRDLQPDQKQFAGWRFNNVQPVVRPDGSIVEGALLFYGWKDPDTPDAKAFLFFDDPASVRLN